MAKRPSPRQLEVLRGLCAATGERYYRPKTSKQAQGRIQLLAGIKKGTITVRRIGDPAPGKSAVDHSSEYSSDRFAQLPHLFAQLKRAHYTLARREDAGASVRGLPARISHLERQIDEIVEAPHS